MRALIQRVTQASVSVAGQKVGEIDQGLLVLLGVAQGDDSSQVQKLAERLINYRIFSDDQGRMNQSLKTIEAELLIVSQFTLCADTQKGLRPGFSTAAPPDIAEQLYKDFVDYCRQQITRVETGIFGADMQVALINDGPVTFLLES